ncbi:MAG: PhoX family phosphatase [Actinomycetota bacterium]
MTDVSDDAVCNTSGNRPFGEILEASLSRRNFLAGGMATGAAAFLVGGSGSLMGAGTAAAGPRGNPGRLISFDAIAPSVEDAVIVPDGYSTHVIARWGDPIVPSGPAFATDASNSAEEQEHQFGMGHDGMHYFPIGRGKAGSRRGMLVMNHEFTTGNLLFPDGEETWDADKTAKEQRAHGVAVCEVAQNRRTKEWSVVESRRARRIHVQTPMTFSGPAAGHRLLQTDADPDGTTPVGTVNNCAHGSTPWKTYLTCEENFNGYFWNSGEGELTEEQAALFDRYGVSEFGFGYQWASTDDRFRADLNPNETNRFGWVVEIDPMDPDQTPVKRTALGRLKHEGAVVTESRRKHAVVYMGDDQRFDYIYKYVSARPWRQMTADGVSPLDEGTLYVARFDEDGTGAWLPLVYGEGPLTEENGFADQGDVMVKARMAADVLGATPMDRPEWTAVDPKTNDVYCTLTNNTRREEGDTDAANPRGPNDWGHIIRWTEAGSDNAAPDDFAWDLFVLAGPGDGVDGSTVSADAAFGSPDGLWFDDDGRLWIQTDGRQPVESTDQMLVADPDTGEFKRFLTAVPGCEVTGVVTTPDRRTMFVNIQHPGDAGTPEDPTLESSWPDYDGTRPRPATVVITKDDGFRIGT